MISFCRNLTVTAEFPDDATVRMRGALNDHIYAMDLQVDVRIADGEIEEISTVMSSGPL